MNAQWLLRAGLVDKLMSGVWTYLPLGLRVLKNIQNIIREELDAFGAQEILMPTLHPASLWKQTNRWNTDIMYHVEGEEAGLGWTHEEVVTSLAKRFVASYKDLPFAVYQIQDKFRKEPRSRSGLLRGREFSMKDLYSFHATEKDLERYYAAIQKVYKRIFRRCGLDAKLVEASGGAFSAYSLEYQVIAESGEDTIYYCSKCGIYRNKELESCHAGRKEHRSIEVGNIFKLGTRFSETFDLAYNDATGKKNLVFMGCYGIGPSRILGTVVEIHHDAQGIIWPKEIAPFQVHFLDFQGTGGKMYTALQKQGFSVLYDDRSVSPGVKLKDADLLGIPVRIILSEKNKGKFELKERKRKKLILLNSHASEKYIRKVYA